MAFLMKRMENGVFSGILRESSVASGMDFIVQWKLKKYGDLAEGGNPFGNHKLERITLSL
ncbi:MAG: hypothetical protein IJM95_07715 [Anaerotignum sp.]|nr:hypothetical protein [Anaerotignum sp.]